jgi:hypothetical protein
MRPILDFDSVTHARIHGTSGTPGHTSEAAPESNANPEESEFFRAGEAGSYEGGPADPAFEPEPEVLEPERPVIVRTPEQEARRARFARGVAATVGALAALLAFGVVRTNIATASSPAVAPPVAAAAAPRVGEAPRETKLELAAEVAPAQPQAPAAAVEPAAAPAKPVAEPVASKPRPVVRRAPAPAAVEPEPALTPRPAVADGTVPTAAFPSVR